MFMVWHHLLSAVRGNKCESLPKFMSRCLLSSALCSHLISVFLPPLPTSPLTRSFPLLSSHLFCTRTFCYDQSDYIRALRWEAARKERSRELRATAASHFPSFTPLFLSPSPTHTHTNSRFFLCGQTAARVAQRWLL